MAFTLIELLVAIAVLGLMMTLAARIFFDAQTGVQRGLQTSQIIAESRSIAQPLADDIRAMNVFESRFGSNAPGFLVIHQNAFPGVRFPVPGDIEVDTIDWPDFIDDDEDGMLDPGEQSFMRSDQISFFRDANGLESLTPGTESTYDSQAIARHARVWYGHVWPADVMVPAGGSNPGQPGYDLSSQMILGRQALLLVENDPGTTHPDGTAGDVGPSGDNLVAGAAGGVSLNTFGGFNDVLDLNTFNRGGVDYEVYDDQGVDPTAPGASRGLFRTPSFGSLAATNPSFFGNIVGPGGLPNIDYAIAAEEWLYLRNGERLQAATAIETDFTGGIFDANTIGQLHAAFAPHVADFAIEFAADWSDDWDDVSMPGTRLRGPDGFPDNEPDRDDAGNIVWYTLLNPNPDGNGPGADLPNGDGIYDGVGQNDPRAPVTYDASLIEVARFDGVVPATPPFNAGVSNNVTLNNPMIQNIGPGLSFFIFAHTGDDDTTPEVEGGGKYWPYLIRFRYRLMDGKGEFRSIDTNPDGNFNGNPNDPDEFPVVGRWFEQIVPVPRPRVLF